MIFALFDRKRRKENHRVVARVYEALTAAGRQPALYEAMNVPDTVMGRFEMLAAHVILLLRRTAKGNAAVQAIGQDIVDEFFVDVDHSIRELGIGDISVPKKMKKFASMFYGRMDTYDKAIAAHDEGALADALGRNIHPGGNIEDTAMSELARYLIAADHRLADLDDASIARGDLFFPDTVVALPAGECA